MSEESTALVSGGSSKVDILIVDDNPKNLMALEAMLTELAQNVVVAHSGREALRRLLEQDFALTLLDIQMPELDGFQTAKLIRSRERSRHMPIIFLTAFHRTDEQISQAYSLGAVDFLFKPVSPFILRAKVLAFVELFRKTEEVKRQAQLLREVELREHERALVEAAQLWEAQRLREEMIKERNAAEALAREVAERERAEEALQDSNRRLKLLSEMANQLLLGARPEDFLASLYRKLAAHLHLEVYFNYLVAEDGHTLRLEAFGGVSAEAAERVTELNDSDASVASLVARSRALRVIENVQENREPSYEFVRSLGIHAYACFPLLAQDRLLGTLGFGTRQRAAFDPDHVAMMQVVCDQVAVALERARLIDELSRRNQALADVDRRKDEFLAMLAHELRNPLSPILTAVQVLRRTDAHGREAERARDAIDRQVHHMVRLVDDLLDLSRITTGKVELRKESIALSSVIDYAVQSSAPIVQQREHKLVVSSRSGDVHMMADPTRLGQVVANLLNNAAKYSPPGTQIELSSGREGDEVVISVRDAGMGIPPDMIAHVFDLFVQVNRHSDRSQGGLGIGLTLARSLIEMHGGTISAHSEGVGRGSEFVVRLPIGPQPPKKSEPVALAPQVPHVGLRVAVIEDNPDVREILCTFLSLCGHTVLSADDGRTGIDLLLNERPDVALIDIGLPLMDGYQLASEIRSRAPDFPTRMIALSGYGRPEDRRRALESGFHEHLVKPVDSDVLERMLQEKH